MTGYKSIILSMDTATGPCSVAVWKDGKISACLENPQFTKQSASLLPMIEEALKQSRINYSDLTGVASTVGPGSFTGIRVGLATASAIAFSAHIPTLGYTTLETVAFAAKQQAGSDPILAILNAGKGEWYYQVFSNAPQWHAVSEPQLASFETAIASLPANTIIAGNATDIPPGWRSAPLTFPRADALAELAAGHTDHARSFTPYYIREPDAKPMKVDS